MLRLTISISDEVLNTRVTVSHMGHSYHRANLVLTGTQCQAMQELNSINIIYKPPEFFKTILKPFTPCVLAVSHFFLFQLNTLNILNTYIYHQLPPTCFDVCYTVFRETIALLAQKLYAFCNVAIKCTIYPVFFKFTALLQCLKHMYFFLV